MTWLDNRLLFCLIASILVACSEPYERVLSEYPSRLQRVLEVDGVGTASGLAARPVERPSRRELLLPLKTADINLLEFLRLNQCQLGRVVGEKNSVLGKLAKGSQFMHLERDFLLQAPACIQTLDDQTLANELRNALSMKQRQRMAVWWNAWAASDEFMDMASISVYPLALEKEAHVQQTLLGFEYALRQGRKWRDSYYDYRVADMEHHLRQWSLGESVGRWQVTQARLTQVLEQTTRWVAQRQVSKPLCPVGQKTRKAEILRNVLERFYVGELQPYMSSTDRFGGELLAHLQSMEALLGRSPPVAWNDWLERLIQSRARFQQASRAHVQAMSRLFDGCGMSVGGAG